jgi:hypothetical protein
LQSLFGELGASLPRILILRCDNIGATYLTSNPLFHARSKHIAIDYHFVRDRVAAKQLEVHFLSSKDQIADILTSPLATKRFSVLTSNLNIRPTLSLRGRIGSHNDQRHLNQQMTESHEDMRHLSHQTLEDKQQLSDTPVALS